MIKERFTTGKSPYIRVESCQGDLVIRGWAESCLEIKGDFQTYESDKGYQITGQGNLYLMVPGDAILSAGKIGGDLNIRQATGAGSFEYVQGDVVLSSAGDTNIGIVHGDIHARNLIGTLSITEVNGDVVARVIRSANFNAIHGDLSVRIMDGPLTIESINGDAELRTINGSVVIKQGFRDVNLNRINGVITVTSVTGDIRLRGGLLEGNHTLASRGDIVVRWPSGLPVNLTVSAAKIDNRIPLEDLTEKKGGLSGRIGQGETNLALKTEGRVILRETDLIEEKGSYEMEFDFGMDMAGIAARIEAEVNNHLSRVTRDLEGKFGADFGRHVAEKVARKTEKAADRTRRHPGSRDRTVGSDFASTPSAPSKKATSSEEQLKILKMVENGKISPAEAGMLLEALEA